MLCRAPIGKELPMESVWLLLLPAATVQLCPPQCPARPAL